MAPANFNSPSIPARLRPGDTIGIAAPAGPFDPELFRRGTKVLRDQGFDIFMPPGLREAQGYLAGSDQHRAGSINQLFADQNIDAIICARGGYGSIRTLSLLDYELIADNPKVFIGFSDITALLSVLTARCNLATFHGPVVTSLADAAVETRASLMRAVASGTKVEFKNANAMTIRPGIGSGVVVGGNLTTLCHLIGTSYAPNFSEKILFLEDCAEAPYRIDRMLMHMKLAGCFQNLAGVVLGSFENCGAIDDIYNIVADTYQDDSLPILGGLEVGHGQINLTIPFGIEAVLDADGHSLSFHQAATL